MSAVHHLRSVYEPLILSACARGERLLALRLTYRAQREIRRVAAR